MLLAEVNKSQPKTRRRRTPAAAPRQVTIDPGVWSFIGWAVATLVIAGLLVNSPSYGLAWFFLLILYAFSGPRPQKNYSQSNADPLQQQLLSMLNGDRRTAQRLLNDCRRSHPGMSADWYLEKVIYDLRRDRR